MERWINSTTLIAVVTGIIAMSGAYYALKTDFNTLENQMDVKLGAIQLEQQEKISAVSIKVEVLAQKVEDIETDVARRLEKIEDMLTQVLEGFWAGKHQ